MPKGWFVGSHARKIMKQVMVFHNQVRHFSDVEERYTETVARTFDHFRREWGVIPFSERTVSSDNFASATMQMAKENTAPLSLRLVAYLVAIAILQMRHGDKITDFQYEVVVMVVEHEIPPDF